MPILRTPPRHHDIAGTDAIRTRSCGGRRLRGAACIPWVLTGLLVLAAPSRAQDDPPTTIGLEPRPAALMEAPLDPATEAPTEDVGVPQLPATDLERWLDEKSRTHRMALAQEARLLYRRGLIAKGDGDWDEAVRLVRGAAQLDPTFMEPHWALAGWFLLRDPGQSIHEVATLFEIARQSFVVQIDLLGNLVFLILQGLFLGMVATALLLVVLRGAEVRHAIQEHLARHLTRPSAAFWAWIVFLAPFAAGAGLVLPTALLLAFLWPASRIRERIVFVAMVASFLLVPFAISRLTVMEAPMHRDQAPFFGVHMMQNEAYSPKRQEDLLRLSTEHSDNPFVQFGLGWMARQGNDAVAAEEAYRRAVEHWQGNARVLNNLGNALALQGRLDEAIEVYQRAIRLDPDNAAAYYNMAQAHTQRFEFRASNDALSRASALDFDLVRIHQAQITDDGVMPRVDQWLAPSSFWKALLDVPPGATYVLPPAWRGRIETSTGAFPIALVVVVAIGLTAGILQKRVLPMRRCSNCDRVVCRRCAERRRQVALCRACAKAESAAASPEFARTLLVQQRRKIQGKLSIVRTTFAALVPGFGMLVYRRVFTAFVLLAWTAILTTLAFGLGTPFTYEPSPEVPNLRLSIATTIVPWFLLYSISLLSYFRARLRYRAERDKAASADRRPPVRPALSEAA